MFAINIDNIHIELIKYTLQTSKIDKKNISNYIEYKTNNLDIK